MVRNMKIDRVMQRFMIEASNRWMAAHSLFDYINIIRSTFQGKTSFREIRDRKKEGGVS